jgi:hypothetical protein
MPPKDNADLAHAGVADWILGTLGPAEAEEFQLHLTSCQHCQAAVAEFGELGQVLQNLPPAVEPPPDLQARTIAGVLVAASFEQAATQLNQVPEASPRAAEPGATEVVPIPLVPRESPQDERPAGGPARIIRFPGWHGRARLLSIAGGVAAAVVIAALVILPSFGRNSVPAQPTVAFDLSSPSGASGTVTARSDPSGSWDITLTVQHLPASTGLQWYECWYVNSKRQVASAGTFVIASSGKGTFDMTSGVDPRDFRMMEIVAESPSSTGAKQSTVVLSGQAEA